MACWLFLCLYIIICSNLPVMGEGRKGPRQAVMAHIVWARHVLQWRIQKIAFAYLKFSLSSDGALQLECLMSESLVIADQHAAVNPTSALHTPPVTLWEWTCFKLLNLHSFLLFRSMIVKVTYSRFVTGVKS